MKVSGAQRRETSGPRTDDVISHSSAQESFIVFNRPHYLFDFGGGGGGALAGGAADDAVAADFAVCFGDSA
jgi:hypothetical protein